MIRPANQDQAPLIQRLQDAIKEQREVTRLIREQANQNQIASETLQEQRRIAWASLRGTATYHGDIVAPLGIKWDAAE